MSHMVIYRGADGKPGYHQTDDIHDAVGFVEQMRNDEGVEHARIFRLEEVVFQYKPYYRVELAESGGAGELGTANGGSSDGSNASGSTGSKPADGDAASTGNGGGSSSSDGGNGAGGNGASEATAAVGGSDDGGSKKGLFGR